MSPINATINMHAGIRTLHHAYMKRTKKNHHLQNVEAASHHIIEGLKVVLEYEKRVREEKRYK